MTDKTSSNNDNSSNAPDQEPNISDFYIMGLFNKILEKFCNILKIRRNNRRRHVWKSKKGLAHYNPRKS